LLLGHSPNVTQTTNRRRIARATTTNTDSGVHCFKLSVPLAVLALVVPVAAGAVTAGLVWVVAADFALAIHTLVARWNTAAGAVAAEHIRVVGVDIPAAVFRTSLTLLPLAIKDAILLAFAPLVANRAVRWWRVPAGIGRTLHSSKRSR